MKLNTLLQLTVFVAGLVLLPMTASHADEIDDFVDEYAKVVEMYEGLVKNDTVSQADMNSFNQSMTSLSQKAANVQSSGKQMNEKQMQKLNELGTRMSKVFEQISKKVK